MRFTLIFFLTLGMACMGYSAETLTVTRVEKGIVTMGDYTIPEAEAWREGDKAEAIIRNGEIIEVRYRRLQRWCNNFVFWSVPTFEEYTA